jgi:hypothetical protein
LTGAKIGIAVPVVVVSVAVFMGVWIWMRRKRRARKQVTAAVVSDMPEVDWRTEYQGRQFSTKEEVSRSYTQEMGSDGVLLGPTSQAYEAPLVQPQVFEAAGQTQRMSGINGSSVTQELDTRSPIELENPQPNSMLASPANVRMETQLPILPVQLQQEVVKEPENDPEILRLQKERLRLQEKKARLKQLQDLEDEEESLTAEMENRLREINSSLPVGKEDQPPLTPDLTN